MSSQAILWTQAANERGLSVSKYLQTKTCQGK